MGFSIELEITTMNTFKRISAFLVAITMTFMLGCASTAKHEGTGEYVDDTVITAKVKAEIFEEKGLKSAEINVETFKGVVQLSGFVADLCNSDVRTLFHGGCDKFAYGREVV